MYAQMKAKMGPDHKEFEEVSLALEQVTAAAAYNNEAIRAKDDQSNQMREMLDISQKTKIDVLDKPRVLLKQGAFPCYRFVLAVCHQLSFLY